MATSICGVDATPEHQIRRLCLPGGWWKKWDEVCDQAFGTNYEVSEKNWADSVLETSQHTGVYWFLASSREIFIHRRN